jgi:hypothetical protein
MIKPQRQTNHDTQQEENNMKIYARQISPEYQDSLPYTGDELGEYITICGNDRYQEYIQPVFKRVQDVLNDGYLAEVLEDIQSFPEYKNSADAIVDYLRPEKGEYSARDIAELEKLVAEHAEFNRGREDTILCAVLSVVTGSKWAHRQIRGCCQSDWNYAYYQEKDFPGGIDCIEALYFNTGSEWIVHDEGEQPEDPEDICGWGMYCFGWNDEAIKKEIAEAAGAEPGDVVLYKWSGYRKIATYEVA